MKCPHCGQNLTEGARFCNRCGQPVARQPVPPENQKSGKTCSYCGQSLLPGALFCNKCGKPLTPEPRPEDQAPAEPVLPEEKTESFRQEAPAPKRRSPIGVVAVVVILVLLAAGGWWFANQLKEDQTLPASSAVEQMEEQMPIVSAIGYADETGEIHPMDDAAMEYPAMQQYQNMQYYYFYDRSEE